MEKKEIKKLIGETFNEIADAIKSGNFKAKVKIGLTTLGSEHGVDTLVKSAEQVTSDFDVVLIGPKVDTHLEIIEANNEKEMHQKMEELLDSNYIQGCVTLHYSFPIGVSTVGRVVTPALGKEMLLATTTGTSDTDRTISMFKNAVYGLIIAKALGIKNPSLGILNVDNARSVERLIKKLISNGYEINLAESIRNDGGSIMRGNDLITGSPDVMVTDTLTGNLLMKLFSSFNTGGSYEALGYGYGPGIGFDYQRLISIISRASGIPVIVNALKYTAQLAQNNLLSVIKAEYKKLQEAKFLEIIVEYQQGTSSKTAKNDDYKKPEKEIVSEEISGIDILELETAVELLMRNGIYAESGMGCTGPVILVSKQNKEKATEILKNNNYL